MDNLLKETEERTPDQNETELSPYQKERGCDQRKRVYGLLCNLGKIGLNYLDSRGCPFESCVLFGVAGPHAYSCMIRNGSTLATHLFTETCCPHTSASGGKLYRSYLQEHSDLFDH